MQHGSRSRNLQTQRTKNDFLTRSIAQGRRTKAAILEGRLFVFFVLVSNHYFTIVLFFWSSSTYNTHINKSGQDSHTKTFSELHQFRSRLESRSYQLLYNLLLQITFRLLFSNPQAATTLVDELSESHSEHKSIEGMRTSPCCSKRFISSNH